MIVNGRPGRVLVALLAGSGGRNLEQLTEAVWLGHPPNTARSALHVHLSTLRKIFATAPAGLAIERHGERYVLNRSGWDLDVELVTAYGQRANELMGSDPRAAAQWLSRALDLWAGVAFTVGGVLISEIATHRLELHRLDLQERFVEALLDAGETSRAERFAVEFVDAEPYRERRWGQLMRSLTLQGRSVDALAAYERASNTLQQELGVSPSEELERLERSILTHNVSAAASQFWPSVDLSEIPGALGALIGRAELLERIETALARLVPVAICGAPGAGKTRLAIETARRACAAGQAVGWVDLRNAVFDTRAFDDAVTRWARQNAGGLVVLDNAEHLAEAVDERIAAVIRTAPSVRILVTSRVPPAGDSVVINLDPLAVPLTDDAADTERSESVQLLRSLLDLLAPGVELDPVAAARLCRELGGLPLAIRLAADLARSVPVTQIASASRARLGPDLAGAVAASLAHLGPHHHEAFASVSVVAGQLDHGLLTALVGGDDPQAVISRLVDHGLVQFASGDAAPYSVPEPLREVGVSMLTDADQQRVLDRLCEECLSRAGALAAPTPTSDAGDRLEIVLERELPWHRQALHHLASTGDDRRALDLVAALDLQLYSLGLWHENVELQDIALAIPGPPGASRAHVHAVRGRPGQFHQFDEEQNQTALAMATATGDLATCARAGYHLGIMSWWAGDHDWALTRFEQARSDATAVGDRFLIGEAMRFTGMALVTAGEFERGLAAQLELVHAVERVPQLALLLPHLYMHLGHSRRHVGDLDAALADLVRARNGFERIGNRASLIHVCAGLAEVYADLGQYDEALEAAARSLDVSTGGSVGVYDPWTLCTTARVHIAADDVDLARRAAARAIDALALTFDGETHRVAVELSYVAHGLGEDHAALRLAGLADATPDRRELPFRSPHEQIRLSEARDAARLALGDDADEIYRRGATSDVAEAAARLVHPR